MAAEPIRVLLIEDNPGDARLLREILGEVTSAEFELTHVEKLSDGVAALGEGNFDVILSDLSLPDSQGIRTFERIHAEAPEVPVVVLTGLDDATLAVRAVKEGAQDYLVKGEVTGDVLERSLRYAIERQRTTQYQTLLMERQRFDTAISQMSDGIVVTDGEWRITSANQAACLLLNIANGDWQGRSLDEALEAFELSVAAEGLCTTVERVTSFEVRRPSAEHTLIVDARLTRLFEPSGGLSSSVLTVRDVTEERYEQRLRSDFFTLVSHKIRTPLTVLTGYFYLWEQVSPDEAAERWAEMLQTCSGQLDRLNTVVDDVLDFAVLSTSELEAKAHQTEVGSVVADVCETVRRRYSGKRLKVVTDIASVATHTNASGEHAAFVLEKVLDNAAKFTDHDPVEIEIRVEREEPSWLRFSVTDNGPGIPHEYHERVFQAMVQVEESVTGQVPGLGVGLFLARRVVETYGGTISLQSQMGEGCTVTFALPATQLTSTALTRTGDRS